MDFISPYLHAMREEAPRMFMALRRAGTLDDHLQQKSTEAHTMLEQLLAKEPKLPNGLPENQQALRAAEEIVRATLIEFPPEDKPGRRSREPQDDQPLP
jgi:hypothetical protein